MLPGGITKNHFHAHANAQSNNYCQLSKRPAKISTRRRAKRRFEFAFFHLAGKDRKKRPQKPIETLVGWLRLQLRFRFRCGTLLLLLLHLPGCLLASARRCHNLCGAVYAGNGLICYDLSVKLLNYWLARHLVALFALRYSFRATRKGAPSVPRLRDRAYE